jgi:hypothetical protein
VPRDGDSNSVPPTSKVAANTTSTSLPAATGGDRDRDKPSAESGDGSELGSVDGEKGSTVGSLLVQDPPTTSIGLICVTGESDFDVIRVWGEGVIQVGCCFPF